MNIKAKAQDGLVDEMQIIEDIIKANIDVHEMGQKEWVAFKHGRDNPIPPKDNECCSYRKAGGKSKQKAKSK